MHPDRDTPAKDHELSTVCRNLGPAADCDWRELGCALFAILDRLPVGVFVKDAATLRYVFRNRVNEHLFGLSHADSVGLTVHELFPPDVAERFEAADHEVLACGRLDMPDHRVVCRDGEERVLRTCKTVLRDGEGRPRLIVGVFEDISETRQIEKTLRAANADLERRVRARTEELERAGRIHQLGEMAAGLAHEINQPLAAIIYTLTGALKRAAGGNLNNAQMQEALQSAIAQAHRSADILARIRDMADRHAPRRQSLRLNELAAEVIELCAPLAKEHDVRLGLEPAVLPEIWADRVQIEQVLLNLVRNGIEAAAEAGGRRRQVVISTALVDQEAAEISVEDSGAGLEAGQLARIFEPFYTTKPHGMGLGLAICQRIVEDHGGRLWAANRAEGGLGLRFTLPLRAARE